MNTITKHWNKGSSWKHVSPIHPCSYNELLINQYPTCINCINVSIKKQQQRVIICYLSACLNLYRYNKNCITLIVKIRCTKRRACLIHLFLTYKLILLYIANQTIVWVGRLCRNLLRIWGYDQSLLSLIFLQDKLWTLSVPHSNRILDKMPMFHYLFMQFLNHIWYNTFFCHDIINNITSLFMHYLEN